MAGNRAEEQVRAPIAYQSWRHVSFLHWRYDPDVVQRLLPDELAPDLLDGEAWVSLTPFLVEGFRVPGLPVVPFLSTYPETNLRTYVRDRNGDEGLWFFSLDVESAVTTAAARLGLGVPYFPARMSVEVNGTTRYVSHRQWRPPAHHRIEVRPGDPLGDNLSDRDARLVGRWRAYSRHAGQLVQVPVEHQPWPLHAATLVDLDESVTTAAGLPRPEGEPVLHYSPGVDTRLGVPRMVRRRSSA